jgi:hypothetical protein
MSTWLTIGSKKKKNGVPRIFIKVFFVLQKPIMSLVKVF